MFAQHSVSGYSTTLYAYIGEFNTDRNRAAIISWISVSIGLANIFIPRKNFHNWHVELKKAHFDFS